MKKGNSKIIQEFCDEFETVLTISNAKGRWIARVTKRTVQVILTTGETLDEAIQRITTKILEKRREVGSK